MNISFFHVAIPRLLKKIFHIEDTLENKISFYHLCYFLISLPFDRFYSTLALISLCIHTAIQLKRKNFNRIDLKKLCIVQAVFLLGIICLIYSLQKEDGINKLGKQAAIFIFPIIFSLLSIDLKKYIPNLLAVFSFTCLGTILYLYIDAFHVILHEHFSLKLIFSGAFVNQNFSEPIDMHATYLAMYACLSLCYFIYQYLTIHKKGYRIACIAACCILSAGIIQLGSKTVLTGMLVCLNVVFPPLVAKGKKRIVYLTISLLASAILIAAVSSIDIFKTRYVTEFKNDLTTNGQPSIPEPRMARWKSAHTLINQSPVAGYGTGSETVLLDQQYYKDKLFISYYFNLNTHNQYLSIALEYGYTGLAIFLCCLAFAFAAAWRSRDILFQCFLITITIAALSENILDTNKGIFFYAFFFSLFFIPDVRKNRMHQVTKRAHQATLLPY